MGPLESFPQDVQVMTPTLTPEIPLSTAQPCAQVGLSPQGLLGRRVNNGGTSLPDYHRLRWDTADRPMGMGRLFESSALRAGLLGAYASVQSWFAQPHAGQWWWLTTVPGVGIAAASVWETRDRIQPTHGIILVSRRNENGQPN